MEHRTSGPQLIREHPAKINDGGTVYDVHVCGEQREDGTWNGWIEFYPNDANYPVRSREETSQLTRTCIECWGDGLDSAYLASVLAQALGRPTERSRPPTAAT